MSVEMTTAGYAVAPVASRTSQWDPVLCVLGIPEAVPEELGPEHLQQQELHTVLLRYVLSRGGGSDSLRRTHS